jgi:hypothetical protein
MNRNTRSCTSAVNPFSSTPLSTASQPTFNQGYMSSIGSSRASSTNNTLENAGAKFLMTDEHKTLVKMLIKSANDKNFPKKNLSLMAKQKNVRRTSISPSQRLDSFSILYAY